MLGGGGWEWNSPMSGPAMGVVGGVCRVPVVCVGNARLKVCVGWGKVCPRHPGRGWAGCGGGGGGVWGFAGQAECGWSRRPVEENVRGVVGPRLL